MRPGHQMGLLSFDEPVTQAPPRLGEDIPYYPLKPTTLSDDHR